MNDEYKEAISKIMYYGLESAPRGMKTKEIFANTLTIDNPKRRLVTLEGLKTVRAYAFSELIWYLKGTNKISELPENYQRIWTTFSDDGHTVNSAYGHRIFGEHKAFLNQFKWCKEKLQTDKHSRQAIININSVIDKASLTKDFPCCISSQYFIRGEKLNNIVVFRSQDANLGLKNDVFTFSAIQELMAINLGIEMGTFTMISSSLHLYEKDFQKAEDLLKSPNINDEIDEINWEIVVDYIGANKAKALGWWTI